MLSLEAPDLANVPTATIAQKTLVTNGRQVPIPVNLTYDPAQMFEGDQLGWSSTTVYPVDPEESPVTVDIG
ncbi:MAG: YbaY family lipoprotein [Cyanobacteria bacterium J06638_6]